MISYEFPLNERVRTLLRLEDLFVRIERFIARSDRTDHHAALNVLFEILEVASRADLKSELLQELDRQKKALNAFHNNPEISEDVLDAILNRLENDSANLLEISGKIGQHLRDNEWLMGIKQRAVIPGGVCEFDLPSYHYWQHLPEDKRRADLTGWLAPLLPLKAGLNILLKLLRESGRARRFTAHQGTFQQMQGGRVAQLLSVSLARSLPCYPEISANKYALNIRFVAADFSAKTSLYEHDVDFSLVFCSLQ
ncbi:cell division protein ZapD [Ferrigenium sp. UT5]|uniref:cell division protein ZapD n=1 Tax=Ferrigenium sp. UT5 TaxID=3242105 RepID=UPI00354BF43F